MMPVYNEWLKLAKNGWPLEADFAFVV